MYPLSDAPLDPPWNPDGRRSAGLAHAPAAQGALAPAPTPLAGIVQGEPPVEGRQRGRRFGRPGRTIAAAGIGAAAGAAITSAVTFPPPPALASPVAASRPAAAALGGTGEYAAIQGGGGRPARAAGGDDGQREVRRLEAELANLTSQRPHTRAASAADLSIRRASVHARLARARALREAAAARLSVARALAARPDAGGSSAAGERVGPSRADQLRAALERDELWVAAVRERTASAKDYWGELGAGKTDAHREVVLARRRLETAEAAVARREAEVAVAVDRELAEGRAAAARRRADELAADATAAAALVAEHERQEREAADEVAAVDRDAAASEAAAERAAALDRRIADAERAALAARLRAAPRDEPAAPAPSRPAVAAGLPAPSDAAAGHDRPAAVPLRLGWTVPAPLLGAALGGLACGALGLLTSRRPSAARPASASIAPEAAHGAAPPAVRVLGTVPDLATAPIAEVGQHHLERALRQLRAELLSPGSDVRGAIYFVAPRAAVGTTSLVAGLAAAFAAAGRSVLVVDANLLRPALHHHARVPSVPGLADLLVGTADPSECIHAAATRLVHVVPAGVADGDPADLLAWPGLGGLIDTLGQGYDHVLVDCPGLDDRAEAAGVLSGASRVVPVIDGRAGVSGPHVDAAVAAFARWAGAVEGMILNRCPPDLREATDALAVRRLGR